MTTTKSIHCIYSWLLSQDTKSNSESTRPTLKDSLLRIMHSPTYFQSYLSKTNNSSDRSISKFYKNRKMSTTILELIWLKHNKGKKETHQALNNFRTLQRCKITTINNDIVELFTKLTLLFLSKGWEFVQITLTYLNSIQKKNYYNIS